MADMHIGLFGLILFIGIFSGAMPRKNKTSIGLILLSAIMFFTLALTMFGLTDIVYTVTTVNESAALNQSNGNLIQFAENKTETMRIIGDGDPLTDDNHNILAWVFMLLALLQVGIFLETALKAGGFF